MEDHRVDLVCPKRHGRGSAPQEKSDWDSLPWVDPNLAVLKLTTQLLVCLHLLAARELAINLSIFSDRPGRGPRLYHQAER